MSGKTLYLFTKKFPYGTSEKYISDELPFVAAVYEKVYLVPAELFGETGKMNYTLPLNVEVLHLNDLALKNRIPDGRNLSEFLGIVINELVNHPVRKYWFRFFRRYLSILSYQQYLAGIFSNYLRQNGTDLNKTDFYSYWFHNSALMLAILKKRGVIDRFISRGHSIDLYNEWWPGISSKMTPLPFFYFRLKWVDKLVAISDHGVAHLKRYFPHFAAKFVTSRLGVASHGLNDAGNGDEFVIVTCSNLSENKRVYRMPGILSLCKSNIRWVHFGGDSQGLMKLKEQCASLNSSIKADFKGHVQPSEILNYYSSSPVHLFINLSRVEGLPVSIMEAMSFGIPCMATAVYGTPEIVYNSNGFLLGPDFSDQQAAVFIDELATNSKLQNMLRKGARNTFEKSYVAADNFQRFISDNLRIAE